MRSWVLAVCFTGSDKYLQWKAREYFFFRATDFFYDKMHSMKSRFFFIDGDSIRAYRSGGVTCRDRAAQGGRIASAGGAVHSAGQFSQAVFGVTEHEEDGGDQQEPVCAPDCRFPNERCVPFR